MAGLTWLHLSDWHQKGPDFDRQVVRDALLADLQQRVKIDGRLGQIDFVVFSGDVAWQGKPEEYQAARDVLFDPVLKAVGLGAKDLFIVPGNHDLDRAYVQKMLPAALNKPLESNEQVQEWLATEDERNRALEPFKAFANFVAGYTRQDPAAYANSRRFFVGKTTVGIICLNSAWMCGRNKDPKGEVNDYGFLTLGEPQIDEALTKTWGADVRLAVLHHPFSWLAEFDRNRVEKRLKRECHFILHGHEHQPRFNLGHELTGDCAVVPAGACYDRRTAKDPRYTNAFNFVHLDLEAGQGMAWLRRWSDRQIRWMDDSDSCPGGKFSFPLPKELGAAKPATTRVVPQPGPVSSPAALSPAIRAYIYRLEVVTSKLQLIGMGQGVQIELPIQQAYIPLNVVVARDLKAEQLLHFDEKALSQREHVEANVLLGDIFKWAARLDSRGVLLLGEPGAGKTTGARELCWRVLNEADLPKAFGLPAGTLPVFLRLRQLTPNHLAQGLKAFITDSVTAASLPPDLAQPGPDLLARRGVLWVFDGLDEVVNENARVHVCTWIKQALADRPDDLFLVTSRYQGYQGRVDLGPAFCQFHVKPLNPDQAAEFVDHWYRAVCRKLHGPGDATEERAAGLIRSLMELLQQPEYRIGHLRELLANPLMLTILCVVHHQDRNLPRRRADLYAKCVRVLVEHWRKEMRDLQQVSAFDPEAAEGVLSAVAWWLHDKEDRTSQTIEELGVVAGKALTDVAPGAGLGRDGVEFIRRMRDESGILAMWSAGQCGFLHRSLQEYLAGFYAARKGLADALVQHVGKSWWREVILVAAGVGSSDFSKKFFTAMLETDAVEKHGAFISQCLDEAKYAVLDPFLDALRTAPQNSLRQSALRQNIAVFEHRLEGGPVAGLERSRQLVDTGLGVLMLKGGGMMLNTPGKLVLRVVNQSRNTLPRQTIQIQQSAEYDVESENPVVLTDVAPQVPRDVTFTIRGKFVQRVTVNYLLNGVLSTQPLYISVIKDNPYVYGNPIGSSEAFFGRRNELEDIVQAVTKPNKQDILLVGERRTGKSSLLYQLETRLQSPFVPVYVVLNEAQDTVEAVVAHLCHNVVASLAKAGIPQARLPKESEDAAPSLTEALAKMLDAARRERPGLSLVLLLDEADFILKVHEQLQNVLRSTFQSREVGPDLRVVAAGTTDLSIYVSERSSPFFNHFRFVTLKPLSESETRELIIKPADTLGLKYEPSAVERIIRASGGHPYYCQRICYEAFSLAGSERDDRVTDDRAARAVKKVLAAADAFHGFVTGFWTPSGPRRPLSREEVAFLTALAAGKHMSHFKSETVKRLVDWQLISCVGGACAFTSELFREWTLRALETYECKPV